MTYSSILLGTPKHSSIDWRFNQNALKKCEISAKLSALNYTQRGTEMISSASPYYIPEYLTHGSKTPDPQNNPLALLAQTCSNIGADNPNNKPILPFLEKSKDSGDSRKDKSPVIISDDPKPSFKPYESVIKRDSESGGKKTPGSKSSSPPAGHRAASPAISSCGKSSPVLSESGSHHPAIKTEATPPTSDATSTALSSTRNTLSGLGYGSSSSLGLDAKESLLPGSGYKHLSSLNPLSNIMTPMPAHLLDVHAYQAAVQSGLLKGSYSLGASPITSPYLGYTRVKSANGGTALLQVCRDPYCTNCTLSMHQHPLMAPCPSGCTQCNHERTGLLGHGMVPGLTGSAAAMAAVASAVPGLSYPPSLLPRPNAPICSWMVGDNYCGKRFNSSEELLQHVRTHTTSLPTSESLSLMSPAYSLPSSSLNAACHMHYSTATSLTSPAGLRRSYPTSLSPVGSLAASRFHPYKPYLSSLPGGAPQLSHPGLGMYYPYSLYNPRLGAPVHP